MAGDIYIPLNAEWLTQLLLLLPVLLLPHAIAAGCWLLAAGFWLLLLLLLATTHAVVHVCMSCLQLMIP
jgi:hypothetical protein